jgi:hypothetical protein
MPICALSRRRRASAVALTTGLATASFSMAAFDNDPANDSMPGADALVTTIGQQTTFGAELVQQADRLDVDFFTIDALAGDAVTIALVRVHNDAFANDADLNLRLHAYTTNADLVSAPGVGLSPAMTFSPASDGVIYIGVGLECDSDLDGVEDTAPGGRSTGVGRVETVVGAYDIVVTIDRQPLQDTLFFFEDPADCFEEVNAHCPPAQTLFPVDGTCVIGSLEKREYPDCQPDTYLVLFDKLNSIIAADDNGSTLGNGWASGLFGVNDAGGFIDDGDGSRSLRIGVTGRPDGLDGVFNGYFLNGPHQQQGEFTLSVTFLSAGGSPVGAESYTDRFETGAEAFHINYEVPAAAATAVILIDNTTGAIAALPDQDVFHLEGLVPFCDYFITQVGGLNRECEPTDTVMAWVDKNCGIIWLSNEYNAPTGYEELTVIADYLGRANFAIAGEDQRARLAAVGLDLVLLDERAPGDCELPDPDIDYGCYTLCFRLAPPHDDAVGPMSNDNVVGGFGGSGGAMLEAMSHGDINMDGRTDTADLGVLIGNFGWQSN